jgi:hypothetical protein
VALHPTLTVKQVLGLGGRIRYEEFKRWTEIVFMNKVSRHKVNDKGEDEEYSYLLAKTYRVYTMLASATK